ncbi:esterase-like activity of phytase family protein [Acidithiobacillus sp. AMEEHan]|uniref:esterase-like activity of phytase family protein n=1 Tax=Acidithiobacillus sp. AMEEHan TaxID=2994951 RepID=UPI0027E47D8E|nr:esterase-like activity of phytase family protein [Acidithiobacillus sp. AMEEHan]
MRYFSLLAVVCSTLLSTSVSQAAELDSTSLRQPLASVVVAGRELHLSIGPGSGLTHAHGTAWTEFYAVSDRGPNIPCDKSGKVLGKEVCGKAEVIFPIPGYTPSIYPLTVQAGQVTLRGEPIPLHASNGQNFTGLPPQLPKGEKPVNAQLQPLPFSPNGVDTECISALAQGGFWIGEEYGPSLLRVAANGVVEERLVPRGTAGFYSGSAVPVRAVLPPLLAQRKLNRGFEGMALAPDQKLLFVALQSPLANPNDDTAKQSRIDRLIALHLDADGNFAGMAGGYAVEFPKIEDFAPGEKQKDLKLSAMSAVDDQRVLLMLRAGSKVAVYLANLDGATKLIGTAWARPDTHPSLEEQNDLAKVGVKPVSLHLLWESDDAFGKGLGKVEGMSLVDGRSLLFISDNDFGIAGGKSTVWEYPLSDEAQRLLR